MRHAANSPSGIVEVVYVCSAVTTAGSPTGLAGTDTHQPLILNFSASQFAGSKSVEEVNDAGEAARGRGVDTPSNLSMALKN